MDASTWGLGGWLAIVGVIAEYVASQLTQADSEKFPLSFAFRVSIWAISSETSACTNNRVLARSPFPTEACRMYVAHVRISLCWKLQGRLEVFDLCSEARPC